jgi:hypothetical protein
MIKVMLVNKSPLKIVLILEYNLVKEKALELALFFKD